MTQQFEPFQKVLVRDNDYDNWRCGIFSHIRKGSPYKYVTIDSAWEKCIPYEGNESLVGTSDSPTPPWPEQNFNFGDKVEVSDDRTRWHKAVYCCKAKGVREFPHTVLRQDFMQIDEWKFCRKADW